MDAAPLHTTVHLLEQIRAGDPHARERLFARCLPLLRSWAHGRLPHYARDLSDTNDIVQVTLVRSLNHLDEFDPERQGSFLAYLRTILLNAVRDEMRRNHRRGRAQSLDDERMAHNLASPVEEAVGSEDMARYETALAELSRNHREAIVLRVEFGLSFPEIAAETGSSADAARMVYNRARARLVELLDNGPHRQAPATE